MKKIYAFIALAMSTVGFAQYNGTGTFTKVTNTTDLTDGYYVITGESDFLMTSARSSTAATGYYLSAAVTPANGNIVDPATTNVWKITTVTNGKTIQSESTSAYVGWSSGNSASAETTVTNTSTWTFSYADSKFTVNNVATPARQLSYNSTSPRFAAYANAGQEELQLYKLVAVANPVLAVTPTSLTGLNYVQNEGPSQSQSFSVSGTDLNGSDVVITAPTNFEVSSDNTTFATTATLTAFNGTATNVYARLATGLAVNTYSGNVTIAGGGATTGGSVAVSGEVSTPLSTEKNNIEGLKVYPNPASDVVNISSSLTGIKEVSIFNMLGKKVLETSTNETINISNLTSGVYIMNISQDGKTASKKLVVK